MPERISDERLAELVSLADWRSHHGQFQADIDTALALRELRERRAAEVQARTWLQAQSASAFAHFGADDLAHAVAHDREPGDD